MRELEQVVRRIVIDTGALLDGAEAARAVTAMGDGGSAAPPAALEGATSPLSSLEEVERRHIADVLCATGGNQSQAASILGIERNTLARKIKRFSLSAEPDKESP